MQSPNPHKSIHVLEPNQADQTKRECVCAGCYGELAVTFDRTTRTSSVTCVTEDCSCPGFVSRRWVDNQKAINRAEAAEARRVLKDAMPWLPRKDESQLLAELGF